MIAECCLRVRARALPAVLAFALAATAPAAAGEAQDRLFALGMLDAVPTGARLVYSHERATAAPAEALAPLPDGSVAIALAAGPEGRTAVVTLRDGTVARSLDPLSASGGHPLLLVFLETAVRSVAAATGGSPFYIRNRLRQALAEQDDRAPLDLAAGGPGERLTFRPFAGDANLARLGSFAELTLTADLADGAPGRLARLEIAAGPPEAPALREIMEFDRMEED
jgi:hypothetical protein